MHHNMSLRFGGVYGRKDDELDQTTAHGPARERLVSLFANPNDMKSLFGGRTTHEVFARLYGPGGGIS